MDHRRHHWLEKFQVQLVTVLVLAVVYFGLWPLLRGRDPHGALSLLAEGSFAKLALFAAVFWLLAGLAAAATFSGRPSGTRIVLLIGMAGLSLQSGQIRTLLWPRLENLDALYVTLIVEVLFLAAMLIVADVIIGLVRGSIGRLMPNWLWKNPLADLSEKERAKLGQAKIDRTYFVGGLLDTAVLNLFMDAFRKAGAEGSKKAPHAAPSRETLARTGEFLLLALVISVALLLALMRSSNRGQILFALLASFFLATLIAHQVFPCPYGAVGWILPIFLAVCFYALAAVSGIGTPPQGWIEVSTYARALPIDWLTAGGGGATAGFWASWRVHEARSLQRLEEGKEA